MFLNYALFIEGGICSCVHVKVKGQLGAGSPLAARGFQGSNSGLSEAGAFIYEPYWPYFFKIKLKDFQ